MKVFICIFLLLKKSQWKENIKALRRIGLLKHKNIVKKLHLIFLQDLSCVTALPLNSFKIRFLRIHAFFTPQTISSWFQSSALPKSNSLNLKDPSQFWSHLNSLQHLFLLSTPFPLWNTFFPWFQWGHNLPSFLLPFWPLLLCPLYHFLSLSLPFKYLCIYFKTVLFGMWWKTHRMTDYKK